MRTLKDSPDADAAICYKRAAQMWQMYWRGRDNAMSRS
jgi:hypothetical protein